jgi:hypothetical protein
VNDKIAASILARLLAKGLLVGIWIPPQEIREARGLVAQRQKGECRCKQSSALEGRTGPPGTTPGSQ